MPTLTLRVAQKHAIRPPNKKTPCHDPLSQKSSFAKENMGYAKKARSEIHAKKACKKKERNNIHAQRHEGKRRRKDNPCFLK